MKLPPKPSLLVLLCSAGLLAASGVMYVKSQTPATVEKPPASVPTGQPAPAASTVPAAPTFTPAQIDQWVAPVALYPDALLSQVLMASTYPVNVVQAVQWSRDNPTLQGDTAIQAAASQPWDPSVKSLVAFPQLLALMGENAQWVEDLGNAFLAQPQDVMNAVQKLRALAQQTGTLKSTPQQTVTQTPKAVAPAPEKSAAAQPAAASAAPAETIIKIESADPQVVYIPTYNPTIVYGTWPNVSYPPVYLPPPPGQQFTDSLVRGFGYSLGVATTYALFSHIDWDDDDDYHHHGHGNGYYRNGDNININVDNYNRISGERLSQSNRVWSHNPAYRDNVPYRDNAVSARYHQTNVAGGLSATQKPTMTPDVQRAAAMQTLQQSTGHKASIQKPATLDTQRQAASRQLNQITQRNNYRGYDDADASARRDAAKSQAKKPTAQQQQRREAAKRDAQQPTAQQQQRRENAQQHRSTVTPQQRTQRRESVNANAFSGNDSRSPSWQAQQQRGMQSRQHSAAERHVPARTRENAPRNREFHR